MADVATTCAVCTRKVLPNMLMCWPHWRQVPPAIQLAVYRTWSALNRSRAPDALQKYRAARQADIDAVRPTASPTTTTTPTGEPT